MRLNEGSWDEIIWVAQCNHMGLYEREAARRLDCSRGESNVTIEAEIGMVQPEAKKCQQSPEVFLQKEQVCWYFALPS